MIVFVINGLEFLEVVVFDDIVRVSFKVMEFNNFEFFYYYLVREDFVKLINILKFEYVIFV